MMAMRPRLESGIREMRPPGMFVTYISLNYYTNVFTVSRYARRLDVSNDQHRNPHNLNTPQIMSERWKTGTDSNG